MWIILKNGEEIARFKEVEQAIDKVYSLGNIHVGMWTHPDWVAFTHEDIEKDSEPTYRITSIIG